MYELLASEGQLNHVFVNVQHGRHHAVQGRRLMMPIHDIPVSLTS